MADPGRYLRTDEQLAPFLNKLANAGKRLFLITNSSFDFVHAGLEFSIGSPDWQQLFDVVICEARKPKFFYKTNRACQCHFHIFAPPNSLNEIIFYTP